jgi:hypothetical protein
MSFEYETRGVASLEEISNGSIIAGGTRKTKVSQEGEEILRVGRSYSDLFVGDYITSLNFSSNSSMTDFVNAVSNDTNVADNISVALGDDFKHSSESSYETSVENFEPKGNIRKLDAGYTRDNSPYSVTLDTESQRVQTGEQEFLVSFYGDVEENIDAVSRYVEELTNVDMDSEELIEEAFERMTEDYDEVRFRNNMPFYETFLTEV